MKNTLVAGLATSLFASALLAQGCPPEVFDYGPPPRDPEIAEIVLSHYGADDPVVPTTDDYARVSRDVALIRGRIPYLADQFHQPDTPPGYFYAAVSDPSNEELLCLNQYYGAAMRELLVVPPISLCIVAFPQPANLLALMNAYAQLETVDAAFPDGYGCPAAGCCSSWWNYVPLRGGSWMWRVRSGTTIGPGGAGCLSLDWSFAVSALGEVTQSPDLTGDGMVDAEDLEALLRSWGPCAGLTGGHCPADLNGDGAVEGADLGILLGAWG